MCICIQHISCVLHTQSQGSVFLIKYWLLHSCSPVFLLYILILHYNHIT